MGEEIFGSETRCCVCGSVSAQRHLWYENQTEWLNPVREVWHCESCRHFLTRAVNDPGHAGRAASFWTREQNEKAVQRAREYYTKGTNKVPVVTTPEARPAVKLSWQDHQKHEQEIAASQHAIDTEARLRQATHELDRPHTPRYPHACLTADLGGNPWNRR